MPDFSILLPPAEGKLAGGNPFAPDMFDYRTSNTFNYFNELNPERRRLIDRVQETVAQHRVQGTDLEALFGVRNEYLEEALRVNLDVYDAPLMSALDRYSPGVMYQAMDFAGLPTGAQRRLLENGVIFSGLFGLLRPDDLIPNYRLRMDAVLPGLGRVVDYWRPIISPILNRTVEGLVVWNLLPSVHQSAWENEQTYRLMVRVAFYHEADGVRRAVTHGVKALRGQLVNFIVRETPEDLEPLKRWTHPAGYVLDPEATTVDEATRTATAVFVLRG